MMKIKGPPINETTKYGCSIKTLSSLKVGFAQLDASPKAFLLPHEGRAGAESSISLRHALLSSVKVFLSLLYSL